ncbi:hypothetical protein HPB49_019774 [Dermacentor silvarum]|uniref:Uncharacterized protein n=1 Tax=Dermacentor silvarum TaxID=543639 RepID=A0ACB8CB06_DERSI|nr:hypothetical protein HPB49_019774 [Dermacentor silvarum]
MPLVNWSEATPADSAGFTVDYLREELARRNLDATGSKEEIISRLIADIAQNRPTTPPLPSPDSAASTQRCNITPLPPSLDAAQATQLLTGLLQRLLYVSQRAAAPVDATIAGIGLVDAFPDSGSKVTLVSRRLVSSLPFDPALD